MKLFPINVILKYQFYILYFGKIKSQVEYEGRQIRIIQNYSRFPSDTGGYSSNGTKKVEAVKRKH